MQSIAHDFPDIAKTYSIGKSFEGRDINVIEITKGGGGGDASSDGDEKAEKKRKAKEGFIQLDAQDDDEEKIDDTLAQADKSEDKDDKKSKDKKSTKPAEAKKEDDKKSKDKKDAKPSEDGFKYTGPEVNDGKPTILQTGATHARELISTNLNVFQMLKLLKKGEIEKDEEWKKLLE